LHKYSYVNENLHKDQQIGISSTIDNWTSLTDPNLYLYLTAGDHIIGVNGEKFTVTWDYANETFSTRAGVSYAITKDLGGVDATIDLVSHSNGTAWPGETVTFTVTPAIVGQIIKTVTAYGYTLEANENGEYSFEMRDVDAEIKVTFVPFNGFTVNVTGGKASVNFIGEAAQLLKANTNDIVTFTVTDPLDGARIGTVTVLDSDNNSLTVNHVNGSDTYSFTMPNKGIKITVMLTPDTTNTSVKITGQSIAVDADSGLVTETTTISGSSLTTGGSVDGEATTIIVDLANSSTADPAKVGAAKLAIDSAAITQIANSDKALVIVTDEGEVTLPAAVLDALSGHDVTLTLAKSGADANNIKVEVEGAAVPANTTVELTIPYQTRSDAPVVVIAGTVEQTSATDTISANTVEVTFDAKFGTDYKILEPIALVEAVNVTGTGAAAIAAAKVSGADVVGNGAEIIATTAQNVNNVELTLDSTALATLDTANVPLSVTTDVGELVFDANALGRISAASNHNDIKLTMNDISTSETTLIELTLTANNAPIFTESGSGTVKATIPYEKKDSSKTVRVRLVVGDVKTDMNATFEDGRASFDTSHFSVYEIDEVTPTVVSATYTITASAGANGSISPVGETTVTRGNSQTFTITPDSSYKVSTISIDNGAATPYSGHSYTFTNVTSDREIHVEFATAETASGSAEDSKQGSGNASSSVWDGKSIDLSWFDPSARTYSISTPAQLAGLAALVNGLYNPEIDTILNGMSYIVVNSGSGDTDGPDGNNQSTANYHYGDYDFAGKTVYITNDINMGSANYMPIGGQYLMTPNDTSTRIDASFNGVFDGCGHTITINVSRHASLFGDGSSIGLIGRLGNHDSEGARASGQAVRNVIVRGSVSGNRSIGGVVGKIGKTISGAIIENCANYATVTGTDAKGTGGIVGSAWNGGEIRNCYNAGNISNSGGFAVGGIAGTAEVAIKNVYNIGQISGSASMAMAIGTNNGGAKLEHGYYLDGTAPGGGWFSGSANNDGVKVSSYMKSDDFLKDLGSAFVKDSGYNNGYPILTFGSYVPRTDTKDDEEKENETQTESTTVKATITGDTATATVTEEEILTILGKLTDAVNGEVRVVIAGDTGANVKTVELELDVASLKDIINAGNNLKFTIVNSLATITFDNATLVGLAENKRDDEVVKIIVTKVDTAVAVEATLNDAQRETVGENFVIDLTVKVGDTVIHDFKGEVTVIVPFTPPKSTEASDYDLLTVYYVDDEGKYTEIKGAHFDTKTKEIKFTTTHFSKFMVSEWISPWNDIIKTDWFYRAARFAYTNDLITGTAIDKFSPRVNLSRAMLVTILWRNAGSPKVEGEIPFSDVKKGEYYTDAVIWAEQNKIIAGYGNGKFGPLDPITREQFATILYNNSGKPFSEPIPDTYTDIDKISAWALEAMKWANRKGLIVGRTTTTLAPIETATRAEAAKLLQNYIEKILEQQD
jgi:hypothetical protein